MSKHNNVNPGQYKVAGRLKPGDPATQEEDREELTRARKEATSEIKRRPGGGRSEAARQDSSRNR